MERNRFGDTDLTISAIGLGCYGMSGVYDPAGDAESIATIRRAPDLSVNFLLPVVASKIRWLKVPAARRLALR